MGVHFIEDRWLWKKYPFIVGAIEDAMELHFIGHYRRYHRIQWDHFDILATGESDIHCKIKKTLLIRNLKPALNENVGSEKLLLY